MYDGSVVVWLMYASVVNETLKPARDKARTDSPRPKRGAMRGTCTHIPEPLPQQACCCRTPDAMFPGHLHRPRPREARLCWAVLVRSIGSYHLKFEDEWCWRRNPHCAEAAVRFLPQELIANHDVLESISGIRLLT